MFLTRKLFATCSGREIFKGTILKRQSRYLEVLSIYHIQRGEGQGSHIDYMDLQTHKQGKIHLSSKDTLETVELSPYEVETEKADLQKGVLVVTDSQYEKIEVPLGCAPWARTGVSAGIRLSILLDGDTFVKLTLPTDLKVSKRR